VLQGHADVFDDAGVVGDGAVELNLIGQDTTSYGQDIAYPAGLSGLLTTLDKQLPDVHWLRLMYAYPSCFTDDMIRAIADNARVVKYIDMPLQHINDEILTRMRRRVTRRQIETLLQKLRTWVPGITLRTTMIAGSPGETPQQHQELVRFIKDFGFDMLGVFPYSAEPGTSMGRMDNQIPDDVKKARVEELMLTQQDVAFAKAKNMIGRKAIALIDRPDGPHFIARTAAQAPEIDSVTFVHAPNLHPGQMVEVEITDYQRYDLIARLPAKKSRRLKMFAPAAV
jgi:ribosomal protein S12 methylthiotransferase